MTAAATLVIHLIGRTRSRGFPPRIASRPADHAVAERGHPPKTGRLWDRGDVGLLGCSPF